MLRGTPAGRRLLWLMTGLVAVAGFTDAAVYTLVADTFVANQAGNLILLGVDFGRWDVVRLWITLTSALSFTLGATAGVLVNRFRPPTPAPPGAAAALLPGRHLLGFAAVAFSAVAVLAVILLGERPPVPTGVRFTVVSIAAFAMGVQSLLLREVWGVQVTTTAAGSAITGLVESVVSPGDGAARQRRKERAVVFGAEIASYLGAASLATALGEVVGLGRWIMVLPVLGFAGCAVGLLRVRADAVSLARQDPRPGGET